MRIGSEIASGEEGTIYALSNNTLYVAKIYKPIVRSINGF